jgi:hypothetical protein
MKLTSVEVTNFCGLKHISFAVGKAGAMISGTNAAGKTRLLRAIKGALSANGIGPECISTGEDKTEILINLDKVRVRKTVTAAGGGSLTVTNEDGDKWSRPQTRLDELFGPSLDPLAFYLAKPAERRKMILALMPAPITAEDLKRWTGDEWEPTEGKHGLEVIGDVRKHYYDRRTEANRKAKESEKTARLKQAEAADLQASAPPVALTVDEARAGVKAAEAFLSELETRGRQAAEQESRAAGTRATITKLRGEAEEIEARGPVVPPLSERAAIDSEMTAHRDKIAELKRALAEEGELLAAAQRKLDDHLARQDAGNRATAATAQKIQQAADLEASLASLTIAAPTPEEIASAADAGCKAGDALKQAQVVATARAATQTYEAAQAEAAQDAHAAAELDAIVETLTTAAPAELAARSQMIPGLAFPGESISLDGVDINLLCGKEQIEFCVDLSKRVNPKGKLLCINGLEQIAEDNLEQFVSLATAGDWQLLGTRTEKGQLRIEAIEPDEPNDEPSPKTPDPKVEKTPRVKVVMPKTTGETKPS